MGDSASWVQVLSVAAAEVEHSAELAVALNDINRQLGFARTFWTGGQVLFESDIWADDLNPANFNHACRNIAGATDAFAPRILSDFGGRPVFQESKDDEYGDTWESRGFGFYL